MFDIYSSRTNNISETYNHSINGQVMSAKSNSSSSSWVATGARPPCSPSTVDDGLWQLWTHILTVRVQEVFEAVNGFRRDYFIRQFIPFWGDAIVEKIVSLCAVFDYFPLKMASMTSTGLTADRFVRPVDYVEFIFNFELLVNFVLQLKILFFYRKYCFTIENFEFL